MIKRMSDHCHQDIEMNFDQDGRRKCVEAEELDCFGDPVFNPPSLSIAQHDGLCMTVKIVGHQKGGMLPAGAFHDDLSEFVVIAFELDNRFKDRRRLVFPFGDVEMNSFPLLIRDLIQGGQELFPSFAQGDEMNVHVVEGIQMLIAGELGIKDKGGVEFALNFLPKGDKA